jgi:D-cysteine desulfhydrase
MLPLFERFPALSSLERVELCTLPSPVEKVALPGGEDVWIKRDDLNAPICAGNKVRSLEFLLGGLKEGDTVYTIGGAGSTHVLCTAIHAARIGVRLDARRWRHDMNPVADIVSSRVTTMLTRAPGWSAPGALIRASWQASRTRSRFIPIGGSTPLGALGHVNGALELAGQIARGEMPMPDKVVVPLGSGGTTAGLLAGFAIAGLPITVVGARVGPRLFVNQYAVLRLARATAALIRSLAGTDVPAVDPSRLRIVQHVYGGAYGRPLAAAADAANILQTAEGILLDDTYSAKAWVAALDEVRSGKGPVLFWLTFDARCLTN